MAAIGLSDERAARFMVALRGGKTPHLFGVNTKSLELYFATHPDYAREARPLMEANAKAARFRKGARLRNRTHCIHGHSLSDAYVSIQLGGYVKRDCRTCWAIRSKRAGVIKPEIAVKVEALLRRGAPISKFTKPGPSYLVEHKTFTRFRFENPHINELVSINRVDAVRRGQQLRKLQDKNEAIRRQNNDYFVIRAMLPAGFPDTDDVVSDIFEAMLDGSLRREDVKARVRTYITAHNRMFPTKYAKFGDSPLVSLDEVLFDDGTATRGDTVSRGLWD